MDELEDEIIQEDDGATTEVDRGINAEEQDENDTDADSNRIVEIVLKSKAKHLLSGEIADSDGNTIFHHCAMETSGKAGPRLLQKIFEYAKSSSDFEIDDGILKKGRNGNTMLHVSFYANRMDIFEELHSSCNAVRKYERDTFLDPLLRLKNNEGLTFLACALKSDLDDQTIIRLIKLLHDDQVKFCYNAVDKNGDTLLHISVRRRRYQLIDFLADKPTDPKILNKAGLTAIQVSD